ncbi:hypothetical protein [Microvirga calopogonii]|uniref:hypothetical protein n=1 Tax=Microvirga calopogonii TaxID=2078013 RepID=UPI000E0D2EBC|nr:hypothetical protein [Microvirga calopogonii]
MRSIIQATVLSGLAVGAAATDAQATTYLFHVSCPDKIFVAQWDTGTIDPGREYLRVTTGTKFANCTVGDYNAARDGNLPRERYSHEGAVIQGVPLVGTIVCGIFGC